MKRFGLLALIALAGCGSTKVVHETRVVTRTTTDVMTVTIKTAPARPVYVETFGGGLEYKPDQMSYYGGEQYIRHIRWFAYGGTSALGRGEWGQNDCLPSCADGHYTYTRVTVRLATREYCRGAMAYRDWTIVGVRFAAGTYWPRSISDHGCA
jgi:hypothetical protein